MYLRTIKVWSSNGAVNKYVRVVEAYRNNGEVKQRTVADLGCKDMLAELFPKLKRLLGQDVAPKTSRDNHLDILDASTWGPVLAVHALFDQLGLWTILDEILGKAKGVPFTDRAFVYIANRPIHPASEHSLAGWKPTSSVIAKAAGLFLVVTSTSVFASTFANWSPGTEPSINSWVPRNESRWLFIIASTPCSVSSRS